MIPGSREYIKLPMPYGYSSIHNFGRNVGEVLAGKKTPIDAMSSSVFNLFENFNPLSGSHSFLNFVSPTLIDPLVDLWTNRDYTGRPIVPDLGPFGPDLPDSQIYWNRTSNIYKWPADILHEMTGGTDIMPGTLEVHPNTLEYMVEYITSGLGSFVKRAFVDPATDTIPDILRGDYQFDSFNDIPFARRIIGNVSEREDVTLYIQNRDRLLMLEKELNDAREKGDFSRMRDAFHKYGKDLTKVSRFKSINSQRNRIIKDMREIQDNPRIPTPAKTAMIKALRARSDDLVEQGNRLAAQ
jgi:hypothetical protein